MSKIHISSTELARSVGEVLGRVCYGRQSFLVEKSGKPVAVIDPIPKVSRKSLRDLAKAWRGAGAVDLKFASALEEVGRADKPVENPWD